MRLTYLLIAFSFFTVSSFAEEPKTDLAGFKKDVLPLLQKYCVACHGPKESEAQLRVDRLAPDMHASDDGELWEEVYNQLSIGDMPPEDHAQPTIAERTAITSWVHHELERAARLRRSTGGNNVLRRLTRYEYNNTLRDLLGIDLDFAKDLPPEGAAKEGFVNNSAVLGTSGLHIEYFQKIAANAIRKAIVPGERPEGFALEFSTVEHVAKSIEPQDQATQSETKKKRKKRKLASKLPIQSSDVAISDGGVIMTAIQPTAKSAGQAIHDGSLIQVQTRDIPREGPIRVAIRARLVNPDVGVIPRLSVALGHDAGSKAKPFKILGTVDISGESIREYTLENRLERFPLQPHDSTKTQFLAIQVLFDEGTAKIVERPQVFVESVRIEANVYESWPPQSRKSLLVAEDIGRILVSFMKRAYRRPVTSEEVNRMATLYRTLRSGGLEHQDAVIETLSAVLSAPGFLLLAEPSTNSRRRSLTNWELATRLSYFLWSTMPDERLFALADDGSLNDESILLGEVTRMLSDDRASSFFENFASQWLDLDAIHNVAINPEFFPDFKDATKDVMVSETVAFFARLVKDNRSALNLIDSNDSVLNAELAKHYGVPGIAGHQMRLVSFPVESKRGGILTHGSILTLNSSGDDTHPIKRGVWVLERLLGDPPPPPPPAVPTLAEESGDGERQSLKQKLEAHRQQDACMTCHRKIDPWGVAFENYDGIGRWRETTEGVQPVLKPSLTNFVASNGDYSFSTQPSVVAPQVTASEDADDREKQLVDSVNESLSSLQRPHNHLRKLGSEGKIDQLQRFLGYIEDRVPRFEDSVDKLLKHTRRDREEFLADFRRSNGDVLESNAEIRAKSAAIVINAGLTISKNKSRSKKNLKKRKVAPELRGAVDPKTQLVDGTEIADLASLKAYLLENKSDQFTETLTRKLLAYSLGRYLDFTDTESVKKIHSRFAADDYRIRSLIKGIVLSETFQTK